eukprot:TRINITY_DN2209_c0_g1_i4.p1 TRINITY_DN2209_c0_g1~~TRINITY_DN2209_c0_g1_i4.p1  ORF type:complete len:130 (-),score=20.12 TRINITY_DN2209_c0_g1_i4:334-723(-)
MNSAKTGPMRAFERLDDSRGTHERAKDGRFGFASPGGISVNVSPSCKFIPKSVERKTPHSIRESPAVLKPSDGSSSWRRDSATRLFLPWQCSIENDRNLLNKGSIASNTGGNFIEKQNSAASRLQFDSV